MDYRDRIALRISELRKHKKISQAQIAAAIGMDPSQFSRVLSGKDKITLEKFVLLAQFLGSTVEDLLGLEDNRQSINKVEEGSMNYGNNTQHAEAPAKELTDKDYLILAQKEHIEDLRKILLKHNLI